MGAQVSPVDVRPMRGRAGCGWVPRRPQRWRHRGGYGLSTRGWGPASRPHSMVPGWGKLKRNTETRRREGLVVTLLPVLRP